MYSQDCTSTSLFIIFQHPNDAVEPGRFEMLIIMPEDHLGLLYFWQKAKKSVGDSSFEGNIIELALKALETKNDKTNLSPRENPRNYVINMPEFKMDSNIGAVGFLQEVSIELHSGTLKYTRSRFYDINCGSFTKEFVTLEIPNPHGLWVKILVEEDLHQL